MVCINLVGISPLLTIDKIWGDRKHPSVTPIILTIRLNLGRLANYALETQKAPALIQLKPPLPLVVAKVSKKTHFDYTHISAIQRTPETHHKKNLLFPSSKLNRKKKPFQNNNPIPTAEFPYMNEPITSDTSESAKSQHHLIIDSPTKLKKKNISQSPCFWLVVFFNDFHVTGFLGGDHPVESTRPFSQVLHQLQELWRWLKSCEEGLPLLSSAKTGQRQKLYVWQSSYNISPNLNFL